MQVAAGPSIIEAMRMLPPPRIDRASGTRAQSQTKTYPQAEDWLALRTIGRGQLIDLVV